MSLTAVTWKRAKAKLRTNMSTRKESAMSPYVMTNVSTSNEGSCEAYAR